MRWLSRVDCVWSPRVLTLLTTVPRVVWLIQENDASARRNAFFMLYNASEELALEFFARIAEDPAAQPEGLQLAILEFARKVCKSNPQQKSRFIAVIFGFLSSPTPAVSFEAASTVVSLSAAPTAIRAAAQTFIKLLCKESDNNVKLIVLERLAELQKLHTKVMSEIVMDLLRALAAPNLVRSSSVGAMHAAWKCASPFLPSCTQDIRTKTLDVAMNLVTPRNVEAVVTLLKKEIVKTQESTGDDNQAFQVLLVEAVHKCVTKYPEVAESVVHLLMDFATSSAVALKVIKFMR